MNAEMQMEAPFKNEAKEELYMKVRGSFFFFFFLVKIFRLIYHKYINNKTIFKQNHLITACVKERERERIIQWVFQGRWSRKKGGGACMVLEFGSRVCLILFYYYLTIMFFKKYIY